MTGQTPGDSNTALPSGWPGNIGVPALGGGVGSTNALGTPENPVTSASAARPTGLTVVYWLTATQPTNLAVGDVWESTA